MCAHYLCRIGLSVCRYLGPAPFYLPWYNQSINQSMNQSVTWHLPYLTLPYPTRRGVFSGTGAIFATYSPVKARSDMDMPEPHGVL